LQNEKDKKKMDWGGKAAGGRVIRTWNHQHLVCRGGKRENFEGPMGELWQAKAKKL